MINFLKEWKGQIGSLEVRQTARPINDGEQLHVMTLFRGVDGCVTHVAGSYVPFAAAEKLADDGFRLEIARRDVSALVKELRATVEATEKALAEEHGQVVRREVLHDERNGRHTP